MKGNEEQYSSCFLDDESTLEIRKIGKTFRGRDSIGKVAKTLFEKFAPAQHWEGNVFIQVGPSLISHKNINIKNIMKNYRKNNLLKI